MESLSVRYTPEIEAKLRFGCSWKTFDDAGSTLIDSLPHGRLIDLGSGDFHHLSYLLIKRLPANQKLHVVVFDNHPDNMRFPFGIHCGSWVYHAAKLPQVSHITVVGIDSSDITGFHLLENHWSPIVAGKLTYLSFLEHKGFSQNLANCFPKTFQTISRDEELLGRITSIDSSPVYLSIDKDVLARSEIVTNWDQGRLTREELLQTIKGLAPFVRAADITGGISFYEYSSWWKRFLSSMDGQPAVDKGELNRLQAEHETLNQQIASCLN